MSAQHAARPLLLAHDLIALFLLCRPDPCSVAGRRPCRHAHKLLLRNMQLHAWPGRYVVTWEGEGRLHFNFDASVASR